MTQQIEKGDRICIPKGTPVWWYGAALISKRIQSVEVIKIREGGFPAEGELVSHLGDGKTMPTVVMWKGSGGYWAEANIENVKLIAKGSGSK